jgi:hypothetical protein
MRDHAELADPEGSRFFQMIDFSFSIASLTQTIGSIENCHAAIIRSIDSTASIFRQNDIIQANRSPTRRASRRSKKPNRRLPAMQTNIRLNGDNHGPPFASSATL